MLEDPIKPGDIIGFSGRSWLSAGINLVTYGVPLWSISHVGVIGRDSYGRDLLFESTILDGLPCELSGEVFLGTQAHRLERVVEVYDGRVWRFPLYRPLYQDEDARLTKFLMATAHTPYDKLGAFRSAGVGLSWIESLFREQNLTSIFCSEWVAAAYAMVGLHATDNVSRWSPNRLTRRLRSFGILREPQRLK